MRLSEIQLPITVVGSTTRKTARLTAHSFTPSVYMPDGYVPSFDKLSRLTVGALGSEKRCDVFPSAAIFISRVFARPKKQSPADEIPELARGLVPHTRWGPVCVMQRSVARKATSNT